MTFIDKIHKDLISTLVAVATNRPTLKLEVEVDDWHDYGMAHYTITLSTRYVETKYYFAIESSRSMDDYNIMWIADSEYERSYDIFRATNTKKMMEI